MLKQLIDISVGISIFILIIYAIKKYIGFWLEAPFKIYDKIIKWYEKRCITKNSKKN